MYSQRAARVSSQQYFFPLNEEDFSRRLFFFHGVSAVPLADLLAGRAHL